MGEDRDPRLLKIGDLAKRFGLNVRTLRYYEAIGLLPAPARTESGYRLYSEEDARRLGFVLQAKRVGFSLEEIRRIVQLGRRANVQHLPMVLVDGKPAECCQLGPVTEAGLRAAGVGTRAL